MYTGREEEEEGPRHVKKKLIRLLFFSLKREVDLTRADNEDISFLTWFFFYLPPLTNISQEQQTAFR
jgi:hypothetical protein